jgi:RNA polymerase sigma-70 factor (ECF subfamily)
LAAQIESSEFRIPPEQLRELYAQYRGALHRFFQKRRPEQAEDLVQTVFLEALGSRPHETIEEPLRYLFGVAFNVLHNHYRRSKREHSRYTATDPRELESVPESAGAWSSDDGQATELMQQAFEEITLLPRACQIAFIRSRRDGWSYQQIAVELKVTPHAVKKYIVKALAHLRVQLRQTSP